MAKGFLVLLFDSGQVCEESWDMSDIHTESLKTRLKRVAQARLALLASSVKIVQLRAKGNPTERVDMPGHGGKFAWPREGLRLTNDIMTSGAITLRGVPREIFERGQLTPTGRAALASFSKTLRECGCIIVRHGETRHITDLHAIGTTLFSFKKDKKAPLYKLKALLGNEKAAQFWEASKMKRDSRE